MVLLGAELPAPLAVLRHLIAFAVLDAVTLVMATLASHWFPQRPSSR
jgi:RIO-like serine/threonine protein kinase